jgi:hypothetical protein
MYPHIEEQLIKSMENWAKIAKPEPCFSINNSPMMTPQDIVEAVKEKTEAGLDIMHILEYAVRTEGVYKVMERFSA